MTFKSARGVMKCLKCMALAWIFFIHCAAYLGGGGVLSSENLKYFPVFLVFSFLQFSVFSFRNSRKRDLEPPGCGILPPGLIFLLIVLAL